MSLVAEIAQLLGLDEDGANGLSYCLCINRRTIQETIIDSGLSPGKAAETRDALIKQVRCAHGRQHASNEARKLTLPSEF